MMMMMMLVVMMMMMMFPLLRRTALTSELPLLWRALLQWLEPLSVQW